MAQYDTNTVANPVQSLKILTLTLMLAPLMIAIAVFFVLYGMFENMLQPSLLLLLPLLGGVVIHMICMKTYENMEPLDPNDTSKKLTVMDLQSGIILRFAIIETLVIIPIALAFIFPVGGYLTLLVGIAVAELLFFNHIYTGSNSHVTKLEDRLDSKGARSGVRELLTN